MTGKLPRDLKPIIGCEIAEIDRAALARLRGVFDDGDEPPAQLAQNILEAYAERLEPDQALLLERWMTCVASAAEELGQDADPSEILARAHEIEARLS